MLYYRNELRFIFFSAVVITIIFILTGWPAPTKTIVILSPHFDDAALSVGGLIAQNKERVVVITYFTEKPKEKKLTYWDAISGFKNSDEAVDKRTQENKKAFASTRATTFNLGFLDQQYRTTTDTQKMLADMTAETKRYIESLPGQVSIYGPAYFGPEIAHPDHHFVHTALTNLYRIHAKNPRYTYYFYEDFPYIARFNEASTHRLKDFLTTTTGITLTEEYILLNDKNMREKTRSISEYSSQVKAFAALERPIVEDAQTFTLRRCLFPPRYMAIACETVYRLDR